ncbi:MAG: hypothetical protein K2L99_03940 [Muribaculaceae bacterium]|nr:hypothetical protein [Muribaculaceae bacterium]
MQESFFDRWLSLAGVRHTEPYSEQAYAGMPFHTLFRLSKLLQSYGMDTQGLHLADKSEITALKPPFAAVMINGGVALVASTANGTARCYDAADGKESTMPLKDFEEAWTGDVLLATPGPAACEPHYGAHRLAAVMTQLRDAGVWVCLAAVFIYTFVVHGLEGRWYTVAITLLDICGLALSFMLVQKTQGVKSRIADRVCGVLQAGGCDDILATKASTFFGIFHWSEVGLAYFGVSLAALLLFPQHIAWLALFNALCLPYTVWSITYQRFVARRWCTMCVGVQCTLWLLFFCYLAGGCFHGAWPLGPGFFILGATYAGTLLALNKFSPKTLNHGNDSSRA